MFPISTPHTLKCSLHRLCAFLCPLDDEKDENKPTIARRISPRPLATDISAAVARRQQRHDSITTISPPRRHRVINGRARSVSAGRACVLDDLTPCCLLTAGIVKTYSAQQPWRRRSNDDVLRTTATEKRAHWTLRRLEDLTLHWRHPQATAPPQQPLTHHDTSLMLMTTANLLQRRTRCPVATTTSVA
ncbi:hypothetical protein BDZ89DRAFT_1222247 [Hymenopellis radicata]|nr:hypothetical protein BDZ89DRAFT_1222247 [Hymenopellis radicata]